jgi:hypothetical protein
MLPTFSEARGISTHFLNFLNSARLLENEKMLKCVMADFTRRIRVESEERRLDCRFCSCRFCSEEDLKKHMERFGSDPHEHLRSWQELHRRTERYSPE